MSKSHDQVEASAPSSLRDATETEREQERLNALADLPLEAIQSAAGLCQSEARKWESADPRTSQHWAQTAMQLQSLDVRIHVWRDQRLLASRGQAPPQVVSQDSCASLAAVAANTSVESPRKVRMFPIQDGPAIPWSIIEPMEWQAKRNHYQTLEELARRGGLSVLEAIAVLQGRDWSEFEKVPLMTRRDDPERKDEARSVLAGIVASRVGTGNQASMEQSGSVPSEAQEKQSHNLEAPPHRETGAAGRALEAIDAAVHSHIDGRDLLDELHPRNTLDIKRRNDGRVTWHEGDWLSDLREAMIQARKVLASETGAAAPSALLSKVEAMKIEYDAADIDDVAAYRLLAFNAINLLAALSPSAQQEPTQ